ncbi:MAG: hypothetical protein R3Y07_07025 [Eubacteriales bacterium]
MNTENYFVLDCEETEIPPINSDELEIIETHLKVTREIQNAYHLLQMFYYNVKVFLTNFDVQASSIYSKSEHCPEDVNIFHGVNAQVVNCISSAHTLIEVIEKQSVIKNVMEPVRVSKYDTNFHYRFLIRLRDFCQHGQIPLSSHNGRFVFDLERIANISDFRLNATIKRELVLIRDDILNKYKDFPYISATLTLSGFTTQIFEVFHRYLLEIKKSLDESKCDLEDLLSRRPELVQIHPDFTQPMIFYLDNKGETHGFANEDSHKMLTNYLTEVTEQLEIETKSFEYLKGSFSFEK